MKFIRRIKESPYYERLKNSLDYTFCVRQAKIISVIFGLILLLFVPVIILAAQNPESIAGAVLALFWLFALIVLWAYVSYGWLEIFLHMDSYIFCQVRLDHPHVEGRAGTYYTVEFIDRHGKTLKRDTKAMFTSNWEPFLEDYNNQTVLIGYNEVTERIVVIGHV